ncbi:stage II sporulation protein M [Arenivirga flava]|uniref:Membrane protein n=1 Tax=Arenivirga flava TaxID=1930060 RepID=A0AA37UJA1_9MICO|nr:stage II sporulation protein M [Arenivirga flava]GMA27980.1 membrane protein [Arenivirga flava]
MDLDAYAADHSEEWDRLDRLARTRRPSGPEADALLDAYRAGSGQLAAMTSTSGESPHAARLSLSLARARLRFTSTPRNVLEQLPAFFVAQLPAALYRVRWTSLAVTAATMLIGLAYGLWAMSEPQVLANLGDEEMRRQLAEEEFVGYYSEYSPSAFTGQVWTNNAWIAAQCVAFGITGLWVPYVILQNAMNLGLTGAVMAEHDRLDLFFLFIAPHGQLELYAIFVAAAGGLMIFWAWVAPGARSRGEALAQDGRALFALVVGLILMLLLSGVVEGFVTRQDWPWPIKIGIGTVALGAVLAYQWVLGRRAALAGETGDLDEFEAGARRLVAG